MISAKKQKPVLIKSTSNAVYLNQEVYGMEHLVNVRWDDEARVWYAICDSIPLALESGSFDALIERVKSAASEILAENGDSGNSIRLRFIAERLEPAAQWLNTKK